MRVEQRPTGALACSERYRGRPGPAAGHGQRWAWLVLCRLPTFEYSSISVSTLVMYSYRETTVEVSKDHLRSERSFASRQLLAHAHDECHLELDVDQRIQELKPSRRHHHLGL